ncbi:substrate-binding periplasmic protein [Pseudoduganella ginsengisoli]|nr:transporter substrate-binding domain-containing protein [Pseudoduganella ginsengisoli]
MLTIIRAFVVLLLALLALHCQAQPVEFRVAFEDKDSYDHTGNGSVVPEHPGVLVELVAMIPARVPNLRITFSRKPWARCLAELEVGAVDAIFSSSFKPERQKTGMYPMADGKPDRRYRMDTKSYSLYKLRETPLEWDGTAFSHVQQGVIAMRGYAIIDDLKKSGVPVMEANSPDDAFRMLLAGRADGFAHLTDFGDLTLRRKPELDRVVKLPMPLATRDYYLQISHQFNARHPELAPKIWKALAEARQAEGERLAAKYLKLYAE